MIKLVVGELFAIRRGDGKVAHGQPKLQREERLAYPLQNIIDKCMEVMAKDWKVKVMYVYREQNRVADTVAKMACARSYCWKELVETPARIMGELEDDHRNAPKAPM
nr:reverse transcriptase [Ipomoea batatas]